MKHVAGLDGLRAIAVVAVVLFHAGSVPFATGGFLGVDVFFVLSGFLITALLAAEHGQDGQIALGRFYLRRFGRLMPALLLLLAGYLAFAPTLWPEMSRGEHARDAVLAGLYLSDYGHALFGLPQVLRHTWSLAVEEHFYLLWPLVLPFLLKCRNPARAMLWLYLIALVWRWTNFALLDWRIAYYRFDTRFVGILAGAWLALWLRQRPAGERLAPPALLPVLALGTCMLLFVSQSWQGQASWLIAMPLIEVATVLLILSVIGNAGEGRSVVLVWLSTPGMVAVGKLSYGIYLWHFPISLLTRGTMHWAASAAICLAGGGLMAWLSWHSVERLGRGLRERQRQAAAQA